MMNDAQAWWDGLPRWRKALHLTGFAFYIMAGVAVLQLVLRLVASGSEEWLAALTDYREWPAVVWIVLLWGALRAVFPYKGGSSVH